jgi:hypothetical protein
MIICSWKLKEFKAHDLVIAVTDIKQKWHFDPCKFLAFNEGNLASIKVETKKDSVVESYRVLLDTRYAGKFFNHGIEVRSYNILEVLGIGIDGNFKLTNRLRKHVTM